MFDTFTTILVFAIVMTFLSLRYVNILFSLVGSIGWLALWVYNMENPLGAVDPDSFMYTLLHFAFIIMAIVTMLMYFRNRGRQYSGYPRTANEEKEYQATLKAPRENSSLMTASNDEYRTRVRRALKRKTK